ncbi:MAG TPA: ThiF family adenylyltransferase [Bdellovibrionota bacterium]|nr:ThiF family adenylyltransferase [Bdellovibrionota bacterium]
MTEAHYSLAFSRNIGLVNEEEQNILKQSRAAIAGMGGVGGAYAVTLARAGIGKFHLADFDKFEVGNFNRQYGATLASVGRPKTEVMKELILSINPAAQIETFHEGVTSDNVARFLEGVDIVMDGLDFYALPARRILFPASERRGIHVVTSGPLGMTTTLHVFGPGGMLFEEYFDFASCRSPEEELVAFLVGVGPAGLHLGQIDSKRVDFAAKKAPSFGTAIQLCAGVACTEAVQIVLKRRPAFLAPRYFQFDPVRLRVKKRYLIFGNRHPLQKFRRWIVKRMLVRKFSATE